MWYIYEVDGTATYSKIKPDTRYIVMDKLPKMPVELGYIAVLTIDWSNNTAEYKLVELELTQEAKNMMRIDEIHEELETLDQIINRATEDLYTLCKVKSYASVQQIIDTKVALRAELQALSNTKRGE